MALTAPAADDLTDFARGLQGAALEPLWESMAALAPAEPRAEAAPFQWRYGEVRPRLMEAGRRITAEQAERRVLVLANPGLPGRHQVTDTLYAGLQLILPGEIAPAHRHTQTALRFVVEGEGAYTAVDGERAEMRPGDLILTPALSWHDHGHQGSGPVVWMDGLDVPLVGFLKAGFREEHRLKAQAAAAGPSQFRFAYADARRRLPDAELDPWLGRRLRYADLGAVMPTLDATLTLLPRGFEGRCYRSTDSAVLTVVEGRVRAEVGYESFVLEAKDVLAIPGWTPWRLQAPEEAVVFAFSDRPVHQAFGLWREERIGA